MAINILYYEIKRDWLAQDTFDGTYPVETAGDWIHLKGVYFTGILNRALFKALDRLSPHLFYGKFVRIQADFDIKRRPPMIYEMEVVDAKE